MLPLAERRPPGWWAYDRNLCPGEDSDCVIVIIPANVNHSNFWHCKCCQPSQNRLNEWFMRRPKCLILHTDSTVFSTSSSLPKTIYLIVHKQTSQFMELGFLKMVIETQWANHNTNKKTQSHPSKIRDSSCVEPFITLSKVERGEKKKLSTKRQKHFFYCYFLLLCTCACFYTLSHSVWLA